MKFLYQLLLICCLLLIFDSSCYDEQGHWLPVDGQRAIINKQLEIEFDRIFDARLRVWGLQYDVNAVIDGKFMKDGKWVEFWTKAQRKELKERFGEVSMLYE